MLIFLLAGCDKDYCWTCESTTITIHSDGRKNDTMSVSQSVCNYDRAQIEEYEEAGTHEATFTSNGVKTVMRTTTHCGK